MKYVEPWDLVVFSLTNLYSKPSGVDWVSFFPKANLYETI